MFVLPGMPEPLHRAEVGDIVEILVPVSHHGQIRRDMGRIGQRGRVVFASDRLCTVELERWKESFHWGDVRVVEQLTEEEAEALQEDLIESGDAAGETHHLVHPRIPPTFSPEPVVDVERFEKAVARFERAVQTFTAGIASNKPREDPTLKGYRKGSPPTFDHEKRMPEVVAMVKQGRTTAQIAEHFECSPSTIQRLRNMAIARKLIPKHCGRGGAKRGDV